MITKRLQELTEALCALQEDATKCENGNKAAGRRVRKACMEISNNIKLFRAMILEKNKE
tara:strand:- start:335 stop:511 length:177 start_codon:yes stop_codon:yes gene_type:complete